MGFILRQTLALLVPCLMNIVTWWKHAAMGEQPLGSVPVSAQLSENDRNHCGGSRCSQWYHKERTGKKTFEKKGILETLAKLHLVSSREDSVRAEIWSEPCWGIALEKSWEAPETSPAITGLVGVHILCHDPTEGQKSVTCRAEIPAILWMGSKGS